MSNNLSNTSNKFSFEDGGAKYNSLSAICERIMQIGAANKDVHFKITRTEVNGSSKTEIVRCQPTAIGAKSYSETIIDIAPENMRKNLEILTIPSSGTLTEENLKKAYNTDFLSTMELKCPSGEWRAYFLSLFKVPEEKKFEFGAEYFSKELARKHGNAQTGIQEKEKLLKEFCASSNQFSAEAKHYYFIQSSSSDAPKFTLHKYNETRVIEISTEQKEVNLQGHSGPVPCYEVRIFKRSEKTNNLSSVFDTFYVLERDSRVFYINTKQAGDKRKAYQESKEKALFVKKATEEGKTLIATKADRTQSEGTKRRRKEAEETKRNGIIQKLRQFPTGVGYAEVAAGRPLAAFPTSRLEELLKKLSESSS